MAHSIYALPEAAENLQQYQRNIISLVLSPVKGKWATSEVRNIFFQSYENCEPKNIMHLLPDGKSMYSECFAFISVFKIMFRTVLRHGTFPIFLQF
jgi:hypothetical protein